MQISIVGRHFRVTEPIKKYINEKIKKLAKFDPRIIGARVILSVEKYRHIVDITLLSKHINLKGKGQTNDIYTSVDSALNRLEKQLQKHRERIKEHRKEIPKELTDEFSSAYVAPPAKHPKVIKSKGFISKPMSVEEAKMELEILKDAGFLVYRNQNNEKVNVLYRRKDGNFGLIEEA
jgi:putative sigma-54 modulation protein